MKKSKLIIIAAILINSVVQLSVANAAEVRSISREIVQKIDGKSFLKVRVRCAEVERPRFIVQAKRSGPWCSADISSECSKQKLKAAKMVCGTHFSRTLDEYIASKSEAPAPNSSEDETNSDVEFAEVEVPLTDTDGGDVAEDELEKRYEEFVENIDF